MTCNRTNLTGASSHSAELKKKMYETFVCTQSGVEFALKQLYTYLANGINQEKKRIVYTDYTPGIYADGYIVFVFPFIRLYVLLFVRSFVIPSRVKVLRQSFSSGVYLSNYLSESIHIWTIVTLEGWHSLHDLGPQGPCPGVGLEVKI